MGPRKYLLWGAEKVEVLFTGLSEIYLFAITLQFLYYRRRNNRLKAGVPMLSYSVLERSNNPYIHKVFKKFKSLIQKEF